MHYLIVIDYSRTGQDKLSFLSPLINSMTHRIPNDRRNLPFINKAGSGAFKQ